MANKICIPTFFIDRRFPLYDRFCQYDSIPAKLSLDSAKLGGDVLQTPFARAILLPDCVGTLLLVDDTCTPMTRVWCVLEAYVTTVEAKGKRFDVAAMIP